MNTLVIDIGGTNVKLWRTGESDKVKFRSGKKLTPESLIKGVRSATAKTEFDRISIGYPGDIVNGAIVAEPFNLGPGWLGFDFTAAFDCPIRMMNDACMQALGSYEGGKMLYLGFGTGVGCTFISDGKIVPLALGHLKLFGGETFDHFLSRKGLELYGTKRWTRAVTQAAEMLKQAFKAEYVVLGGGNAKKLREIPEGCRRGSNHNAYFGGIRMWDDAKEAEARTLSVFPEKSKAAKTS
jgi:polyphosphate glucokinase